MMSKQPRCSSSLADARDVRASPPASGVCSLARSSGYPRYPFWGSGLRWLGRCGDHAVDRCVPFISCARGNHYSCGAGRTATIIFGIGQFFWPTACRIVRGLALSLREQDFFLAARALGATRTHLITWHLIPSVLSPLTVTATFAVAQAILLEAALSFL